MRFCMLFTFSIAAKSCALRTTTNKFMALNLIRRNVASQASLQITIKNPEEMEALGHIIASSIHEGGNTICLNGDLGSGKTCFARGFVREKMANPTLRVTSPSYLLDNTYQIPDKGAIIHHFDLYRLTGSEENWGTLDIHKIMRDHISLIEWPVRLGEKNLPESRLEMLFQLAEDEGGGGGGGGDEESHTRIVTLWPSDRKWEKMVSYWDAKFFNNNE